MKYLEVLRALFGPDAPPRHPVDVADRLSRGARRLLRAVEAEVAAGAQTAAGVRQASAGVYWLL